MQVFLQIGDLNLAEMEHTGSERIIGIPERIDKMLHCSTTTRCNNRDRNKSLQLFESIECEALFHAVMVHARKENLASTSIGHFLCPVEESKLHSFSATLDVAMPSIGI